MKLEKLNVVELQVFEANEIVGGGGWRDIIIGVITNAIYDAGKWAIENGGGLNSTQSSDYQKYRR
ncbi:MAG: hypothetical protein WAT46_01505 [Saprospiraceae bacterium]|jgi:hypothetical protein|nr:hypothetical protein [Saprospiraceae bacterium]MBP6586315.1 hypothetical protein [Flavobacterium sp.]